MMEMSEKSVLTDCLESLKHASEHYLRAALESDSDGMRQRLRNLAVDKAEGSNAVFNMMHQAGIYKTKPADMGEVRDVVTSAKRLLEGIGGPSQPVAREMTRGEDSKLRM